MNTAITLVIIFKAKECVIEDRIVNRIKNQVYPTRYRFEHAFK